MEPTWLVVGLGNPGKDYERTRHNAGFMLVEKLAERWNAGWQTEKKFKAEVARASYDGRRMILAKPQTFMNLSGEAVGPMARFYRVPPGQVVVAVDDADLPLGKVRFRPVGSSGGHHGLDSVEQHLGTREWPRLRLGIGRNDPVKREISGHVLGRFSAEETGTFAKVLDHAVAQVECWLNDGAELAMNRFNGPIAGLNEKKEL
ncbi:MAG: aminoacyl-tRNA hydrolase [Verrucomicrobiales bacterium]|nr:aminoacyl-tRNA hydrolase [Verrucomicrobiales bacterium]